MINLFIMLCILLFHWVGDFLFQTDLQAKNKSKSMKALLSHTLSYSIVIFVGMQLLQWLNVFGSQYWYTSLLFAAVQFVTHTIIDLITSKINSELWAKGDVHNFFVSIGFDQFAHVAILFGSCSVIYAIW